MLRVPYITVWTRELIARVLITIHFVQDLRLCVPYFELSSCFASHSLDHIRFYDISPEKHEPPFVWSISLHILKEGRDPDLVVHRCTVVDFLLFLSINPSSSHPTVTRMSASTSGYSAAYLNENKSANILAPMWTLTMITTTIVIARVYIRVKIVKNVGLDDWTIIAGMVRLSLLLS